MICYALVLVSGEFALKKFRGGEWRPPAGDDSYETGHAHSAEIMPLYFTNNGTDTTV